MKSLLIALLSLLAMTAHAGDVRLNERFPVQDPSSLSPPIVAAPIHVCAKAVHVSGFIPHATIRVFANAVEVIGNATPYFGFADIALTRELNLGDAITATQEVNGVTSAQSWSPVTVTPYPAALPKPVVGRDIFGCGQVVPVDHLEPSAVVRVFQDGVLIGEQQATRTWQPVIVSSLTAGRSITAVQVACPDRAGSTITGPTSDPVTVQTPPSPMPKPVLDPWYPGNDTVTMHDLLTGALIRVTSLGATIGSGLATAAGNWAPVAPPLTSASNPLATQKLCDVSAPSDPVPPSTSLPAPAIVRPLCAGKRFVEIDGTVLNAMVVLRRAGAIIGYGGAVPGRLTLAVGTGVTLSEGDVIEARQYIGAIISPPSTAVVECIAQNVVTQHNDNARSGQMLGETHLTPATVHGGGFGLLYTRRVEGEILAQPLYLRKVPVAGVAKNLFFIATSTNDVYAFDADDRSAGAGPVWHRSPIESTGDAAICDETQPHRVGITSTPVIDPGTRQMYVVARAADGSHHLHVLDVTDGHDVLRPVTIRGSDRGTDFHPACHRNRPGLLLQKGVVYAGFGTFSCDADCGAGDPYHGWVMAYRAADLQFLGAFCTTPGGSAAGIWQSGNGLVGVNDGSPFGLVVFETGNEKDARQPLGDSFVAIHLRSASASPTGYALTEAAHFSPSNGVQLMNGDTDLGSGGPMLLPGNRLIGGGKEGKYYVVRTDMTEISEFQAFLNTWHLPPLIPPGAPDCDRSNIWADLPPGCHMDPGFYQDSEHWSPNIHTGPVYWSFDRGFGLIYQLPEKDVVKAFRYDLAARTVDPAPMVTGTLRQPVDGMPGGFSSISANRTRNGILWVSIPLENGQWNNVPARLVALDARTLEELWRDTDNVTFSKFCAPTVADGYVIRATWFGRVLVYGLANSGAGAGRWHLNPWALGAAVTAAKKPLGGEPEPYCYTLPEKFEALGGAAAFGAGMQEQRLDSEGAAFAELSRSILADGFAASVKPLPLAQRPACDHPEHGYRTRVPVAIYYSKRTCAHAVEGDLLGAWRRSGAEKGKLGYPISDSSITPGGRGRMVVFEHGALVWSQDGTIREAPLPEWAVQAKGAEVAPR